MERKKKLSRSIRKYLRDEKAAIRRTVHDAEEAKKQVRSLLERFYTVV